MDRKEFLTAMGIGAVAVVSTYCLGGCKANEPGITGPANVDFTLDLTAAANSALKSFGGYVYNSGVIVAHTPSGYVAVSLQCTHQGNTVYYDGNSNDFICPAHGSKFNTSGGVINGPASSPLTRYNTSLNGDSLRVYS
jgi:cytochrome b6-f complex iron-sulfur subunit